jgi:hypothetical protein
MKKSITIGRIAFILFIMFFVVNNLKPQVADIYNGTTLPQVKETTRGPVLAPISDIILYENGNLITHLDWGYEGMDISELQDAAFGLTTYGYGHQHDIGYKVADDFPVPDDGWDITGITFYAYMNGSSGFSPITGVYFEIYDGDPMEPASNVIFGDFVTNRLTSTGFSGIYRTLESGSPLSNVRPIMANHCAFNLHLAPGTYWIVWNTDGHSEYSGPWIPPCSVLGLNRTGNALQYTTAWGGAYDLGTQPYTQQALPFIIYGQDQVAVIPVAGWALGIGLMLIIGLAVLRYRRIL